ncbi:hypothetical protein BDA96_04G141100 [Sorghum bicolor]|uniref:Uncharacterized protein n=1 Tax=Sorghum bicolor TaxID=4558 RepID=A0A921R3N7_SORBI|nr:hypothetical protein BDA96_04G141100 [Sorghum bicolor]KAG0532846.1 hypothetical protein BDA96_04G141100 [Sorghum bicolor]
MQDSNSRMQFHPGYSKKEHKMEMMMRSLYLLVSTNLKKKELDEICRLHLQNTWHGVNLYTSAEYGAACAHLELLPRFCGPSPCCRSVVVSAGDSSFFFYLWSAFPSCSRSGIRSVCPRIRGHMVLVLHWCPLNLSVVPAGGCSDVLAAL